MARQPGDHRPAPGAFTIMVEGVKTGGEAMLLLPGLARELAASVNASASHVHKTAKAEMQSQIAFPAGYLPNKARFSLARAKISNPTAVIEAKQRPTSLARFATRNKGKAGVTVMVKPGIRKTMGSAFFMGLQAGKVANVNRGLAMRVKTVGVGTWKDRSGRIFKILYGPSVDQAFRMVAGKHEAEAYVVFRDTLEKLVEEKGL